MNFFGPEGTNEELPLKNNKAEEILGRGLASVGDAILKGR
jgi:hypothetical protein